MLDKVLLFPGAGTNVATRSKGKLDPDFFDECEVVVSHEIINQRVAAASLEVRAGTAVWGEDGRLSLWCSNQGAQGVQIRPG